jgi:hypothetical protein
MSLKLTLPFLLSQIVPIFTNCDNSAEDYKNDLEVLGLSLFPSSDIEN